MLSPASDPFSILFYLILKLCAVVLIIPISQMERPGRWVAQQLAEGHSYEETDPGASLAPKPRLSSQFSRCLLVL